MIPLILAGVAGAAVGAVASSALREEKPPQIIRTEKERMLDSEIPEDVRRQVEEYDSQSNSNYVSSPQDFYQAANEFFYGWNGRKVNKDQAFKLYQRAAEAGHKRAQNKLKMEWGLEDPSWSEPQNADEIYQRAHDYYYGRNGFPKDFNKAVELYSRAADMGHNGARVNLKNFGIYK